ncbi:MAG TPA: hypothetical protein VGK30_18005 [Candidatus Binatia bacterium]|jgi:hypothetical protein
MSADGESLGDAPGTTPVPRALARRVPVIVGAIAVGLVLQLLLRRHLADLQLAAASDPIAARSQLAGELRIGGLALFGLTALLGVAWTVTAIQGWRIGRFPPRSSWLWTETRVFTGPGARRVAVVGAVLGLALVACSLAGMALTLEMVTRLLTCRAA